MDRDLRCAAAHFLGPDRFGGRRAVQLDAVVVNAAATRRELRERTRPIKRDTGIERGQRDQS